MGELTIEKAPSLGEKIKERKLMEALYLVLPLALVFSTAAVFFFVWAAKNGQFDDLDTPAMRILFDEKTKKKTTTTPENPPDTKKEEPPKSA